jgi:hypothetical protein
MVIILILQNVLYKILIDIGTAVIDYAHEICRRWTDVQKAEWFKSEFQQTFPNVSILQPCFLLFGLFLGGDVILSLLSRKITCNISWEVDIFCVGHCISAPFINSEI